jgi:hypothetical protein
VVENCGWMGLADPRADLDQLQISQERHSIVPPQAVTFPCRKGERSEDERI